MGQPLAEPQDVADLWRPLTAAESAQTTALIRVCSGLIRQRVPDIDVQLTKGTVDADVLRYVITEMIKAAVDATRRPVNARQVSESVMDVSTSISFDSAASNRLDFTDDLLGLLVPGRATLRARLRSVRVAPGLAPHQLGTHW